MEDIDTQSDYELEQTSQNFQLFGYEHKNANDFNFSCGICQSTPPYFPSKCNKPECQSSSSRVCFKCKAFKKYHDFNICPDRRRGHKVSDFVSDTALRDLLKASQVRCLFPDCPWEGEAQRFRDHKVDHELVKDTSDKIKT